MLGKLYFYDLHQYQQSEQNLQIVIQQKYDYYDAHFELGNLYKELKDFKKSELYYKAGGKSNYFQSYFNLANLYEYDLKQYEQSVITYKQAIQLFLGEKNHISKNQSSYLINYELIKKQQYNTNNLFLYYLLYYPQYYLKIGLLYENQLNQPKNAEEMYLQAINSQQFYKEALIRLAYLYLTYLNDPENSQKYFNQANIKNTSYDAFTEFSQYYKNQQIENYQNEKYLILLLFFEQIQENQYQSQQYLKENHEKLAEQQDFYIYFKLGQVFEKSDLQLSENYYLKSINEKKDFIHAYYRLHEIYKNDDLKQSFYRKITHILLIQQQLKEDKDLERIYIKDEEYLEENFDEIEEIGEGQFGDVIMIQNKKTEKYLAQKEVSNISQDIDFYLRELENLIILQDQMKNKGLIKIESIIKKDDSLVFVMELAQKNLQELIEDSDSFIEPNIIKQLFKQILSGLQVLYYTNIIHRDIKPANILFFKEKYDFNEYKQKIQFKIADFGSSRVYKQNSEFYEIKKKVEINNNKITTQIGTPMYISPELQQQLEAQQNQIEQNAIDWYSIDIYAAGLSFFEAVCLVEINDELQFNAQKMEEILQKREKQNIYHPLIFEIIRKMIIQDWKKREKINNLLILCKKIP